MLYLMTFIQNWMHAALNGCGMGPLLVLVFPCFRENVFVTCKIGSFLCSLVYLLQKNVIVFFFGSQISKWHSFEKRAIFDLLFTFFSYQGKVTRIPSAHISLTYMYFAHPIDFFTLPILKKLCIYQVWFLFGMIPGVDSYSRQFGTINKEQNGEQNLSWNVYYWYVFTLMPNLVICKPQTEWRRWRLSSVQKSQKALLLSSSHFAFYL